MHQVPRRWVDFSPPIQTSVGHYLAITREAVSVFCQGPRISVVAITDNTPGISTVIEHSRKTVIKFTLYNQNCVLWLIKIHRYQNWFSCIHKQNVWLSDCILRERESIYIIYTAETWHRVLSVKWHPDNGAIPRHEHRADWHFVITHRPAAPLTGLSLTSSWSLSSPQRSKLIVVSCLDTHSSLIYFWYCS